jgi:hypothetical protein
MKNILLIITLFISWNAIAEEKAWYCSTENRAGLSYEEGTWKVSRFKPLRVTVKQQDNTLSFGKHLYSNLSKCNTPYTSTRPEIITCKDATTTFALNTNTGLATSSQAFGWISSKDGDNKHDTLSVSAWKCESF